MPQAVDASHAPTTRVNAQGSPEKAQVLHAGFVQLLTLAQHPAGGIGPGPETIGDRVRAEAKNPGRVDLDDLAAEEMQSPSEQRAHLKASAKEKDSAAPAPTREPTSRTPSPAPEQSSRAPDATPSEKKPGAKPAQTEPKATATRPTGMAARSDTAATTAAATATAPLASAGRAPLGQATSGGVRSVGAVGGGPAAGRDLLAKLAGKQKPPMLRASKEEVPAQVSRALARVVSAGGGRMTLRLNPHALGEVRIDVDMHKGVARATLNAQTESARELLDSNLDALRGALERRGVIVERLEVVGPATDGPAGGLDTGARGGGDHSTAADGSNSHGRSAGRRTGSAESDQTTDLRAERGDEAMTGVPVRTDADGVVRVDAIA